MTSPESLGQFQPNYYLKQSKFVRTKNTHFYKGDDREVHCEIALTTFKNLLFKNHSADFNPTKQKNL